MDQGILSKPVYDKTRAARRVPKLVVGFAVLALITACAKGQAFNGLDAASPDHTASIASGVSAQMTARYEADPGNRAISMPYALALRNEGRYGQAAAVLQQTAIRNPGDIEVGAAYGKVLADLGRFQEALNVLGDVHREDRPDWRILSTIATVYDRMNEPQKARGIYAQALKLAPNEPSIHNNLGLSYLLSRDTENAIKVLSRASTLPGADERIRNNLALAHRLRAQIGTATPKGNTVSSAVHRQG